ncbi:MAG TPA: hypothetical protein VM580_31010, partial [Labilithrix sp.]|nr:hypothetical protein [Labilithrix sp.]
MSLVRTLLLGRPVVRTSELRQGLSIVATTFALLTVTACGSPGGRPAASADAELPPPTGKGTQ